jgi:hypothetical protein
MIRIATVHARTDRWIDVQLRYLERNLHQPHRVYACLIDIDEAYGSRFHFALMREGRARHPEQLDHLVERIAEEAADEDPLVFLDGDAFPIADLGLPIAQMLDGHPLAAVRRDENSMDPQPHPSFCVTTVGFWRQIDGDWRAGEEPWRNADGAWVADQGGKLLRTLEERKIEWKPILRTNARDLHPVFFGVYGDLIYHHGAGFRFPMCRIDYVAIKYSMAGSGLGREQRDEFERHVNERRERNHELSELIFAKLQSDESFWRELFY